MYVLTNPLPKGYFFTQATRSTTDPLHSLVIIAPIHSPEDEAMADIDRIRMIKARHEKELLAMKNVVGVGIGFKETAGGITDRMSIVVMVERKLPAETLDSKDLIPPLIEGIPTDVKAVGKIEALPRG